MGFRVWFRVQQARTWPTRALDSTTRAGTNETKLGGSTSSTIARAINLATCGAPTWTRSDALDPPSVDSIESDGHPRNGAQGVEVSSPKSSAIYKNIDR